MTADSPGTNEKPALETLSDRELILRGVRILEHLDLMVHDVHNWAGRAAPLLDRFGGGFRAALKGGRNGH